MHVYIYIIIIYMYICVCACTCMSECISYVCVCVLVCHFTLLFSSLLSHHFHVDFFSTNEEVQFQVKWTGEVISQIKQVVIAIFILVFVYLLIGFEVMIRLYCICMYCRLSRYMYVIALMTHWGRQVRRLLGAGKI